MKSYIGSRVRQEQCKEYKGTDASITPTNDRDISIECISLALWRPWLLRAEDRELDVQQRRSGEDNGDPRNTGPKGALGFQHPVRLYMPKSKTSEYLQHMGRKVLASFPVQATIHFYNDDSDSEEEDEEMEFYNYYQNCAANGVNSSRGSNDDYSIQGGPKRNISSHTGSA
ncbi:protein ripply3 isoform X1 [Xenopus laevis]|uniref:Protein ripply3 n=1 Tax=Xenopus laevis TaxID=8355 RepID=A0A8J1M710_XENLA|nr:protein ripply3 isoform X1 [Xenopus laevis]